MTTLPNMNATGAAIKARFEKIESKQTAQDQKDTALEQAINGLIKACKTYTGDM